MDRRFLTSHRRWGIGVLSSFAAIILGVVALAGCATPGSADSQYPVSGDTHRINQRVAEINTGWEQYKAGVNACLAGVRREAIPVEAFAPCIGDTYQSSGFAQAAGHLRSQVERTRDTVDSGDCRSALDRLAARVRVLSATIDEFKHDVDAGSSSSYPADTAAITRAWNASVKAEFSMTEACGA